MNGLRQFARNSRRLCNSVILRILTRLSVSWLSLNESFLRQRIWEEWQTRENGRVLLPSGIASKDNLVVTRATADALRQVLKSDAWKLYSQALASLSEEAAEYLMAAEEPGDFRYRKGYYDGHMRTRNLIEVIAGRGEESDEAYVQKEIEKLLTPFRGITLGADSRKDAITPEVEERLSRVMEAARKTS